METFLGNSSATFAPSLKLLENNGGKRGLTTVRNVTLQVLNLL